MTGRPNRSEYPLTRFIGMLLCYTPEQLRNADPSKAAERYKINPSHAVGYIELERRQRGVQ